MKSKGDFIIDILTAKKLSQKDRERVLKLSAKEFEKSDVEYQKILSEIDGLKKAYEVEQTKLTSKIEIIVEDITASKAANRRNNEAINTSYDIDKKNKGTYFNQNVNSNSDKKKDEPKAFVFQKDYINPRLLSDFLIAYNQNPILKTTCHRIDESELARLNEILATNVYDFNKHVAKIREEYFELTKRYRDTNKNLKELIRVYLTGEGQGHWTTDVIKVNWGCKDLIEWAVKYPGIPPNPDEDVIQNLKNIGYEFDEITVNWGTKKIQTFSDLVIHFKHMFHIRSDNQLKELIGKKNIQKGWDKYIQFEIDHEEFWTNIELFSDVDKIIQAYVKIIEMILEVTKKNNLVKPKVKLKFIEEKENVIFSINHENSKFKRTIRNMKEGRFGTKLTSLIENQINGLCELHIKADFDNGQYAEINIWNGKDISPIELASFKGVEFILKFQS